MSPAPINASIVNLDVLSDRTFVISALDSILLKQPLMTSLVEMDGLYKFFAPGSLLVHRHEGEHRHEKHVDEHDTHNEDHDRDDDDHRRRRRAIEEDDHSHEEHHGDEEHHDDEEHHEDEEHHGGNVDPHLHGGTEVPDETEILNRSPHTVLFHPILNSLDPHEETHVVSFVLLIKPWIRHFQGILPEGTRRMDAVLTDSCGYPYTFSLKGTSAFLEGRGDRHNPKFNHLVVKATLSEENREAADVFEGTDGHDHEHCVYRLFVYPTTDYERGHMSNNPWLYALAVVCVFLFTASVFAAYDFSVQKRQKTVMQSATHTQAIVNELFPENVQRRMLEINKSTAISGSNNKAKLSNFLLGIQNDQQGGSKPIADLFPAATIIFADIAGFTSWSSTREPCQVFKLLESVYAEMDATAKKRRVFKVCRAGL